MQIITRAEAKAAGLKRYVTGMACKYGHISERRVSDHGCVECSRLKERDPHQRERRRGYMAAYQHQYREGHPDRVSATVEKGKPAQAAGARRRRAKNPEPGRAALRRSYWKHRNKRLAAALVWRNENKELVSHLRRMGKAARRAIERQAEGKFSSADIKRMLVEQNFICAACPADISENYQVDHIHPLVKGGTNWPTNLALLCPRCNRSKGAKTMEEWISWKQKREKQT